LKLDLKFPTPSHAEAAQAVAVYAGTLENVDSVLVVNSCARGVAVAGSDLDMAILLDGEVDEAAMEGAWFEHGLEDAVVVAFRNGGPFRNVHLDFFDGNFEPASWDDGGGPDDFEIEIGNRVAGAVPLEGSGSRFTALQRQWLPYYDEDLRNDRLEMVRSATIHDLDHVPFFFERALYLQAFDRLYKGFQEYLQALFISHRHYPVAYNKWLDEQLQSIGEGELVEPLFDILSVDDLRSRSLLDHADALRELVEALPE